jgi:hypothetical protein
MSDDGRSGMASSVVIGRQQPVGWPITSRWIGLALRGRISLEIAAFKF